MTFWFSFCCAGCFAVEAGALLLPADWHAGDPFTSACGTCTRGVCRCRSRVILLTRDMCLCRFKVTVLKAKSLPAFATNLNFPLLENDEQWIVQGYTYVSHRLGKPGTGMSCLCISVFDRVNYLQTTSHCREPAWCHS